MTNQMKKDLENARLLLFSHFGISPTKAKQYLDILEKKPEKVTTLLVKLSESIQKLYYTFKANSLEDINRMAKERVEEWKNTIGPLTIHDFVTMSKQWNIPIDAFIDRKITPEIIKQMLDYFVIGQEKYKIMLSVVFYSYFMNRQCSTVTSPQSRLLVCGPSGSGKTYGIQVLSRLFHVPFVIQHCNSLVQEGIIGTTISDGFNSLSSQGWKEEDIKHAVVCFDEFDKLFDKGDVFKSAGTYNMRIVNEMLNIIDDDGEIDVNIVEDHRMKTVKMSTRKMMFVFTGVFEGVKKDKSKDKNIHIGFIRHEEPAEEKLKLDIDKNPTIEDFIEYGVKPEVMGRVRNIVFLNELTEDDMVALFDLGVNSPFNDFGQYFSQNGINAILTDDGKRTLAKLACERKLGVRGLKSIIQQILLEDMYDLEVGPEKILKVTKQYIMDNLRK